MTKHESSVPIPGAFFSYVRFDDSRDNGRLSELRERLAKEVQAQTGESFEIWQDRMSIQWGEQWKERIDHAIDTLTFLIVVVTPSWFKSAACREEFERFLGVEKKRGRADLILPIVYIDTPVLNDAVQRGDDPVATELATRQLFRIDDLRNRKWMASNIGRQIEQMAIAIRDALQRQSTDTPAAPQVEEDRPHTHPVIESSRHDLYPDITSFIFGTPEMRQQREAQIESLVSRSLAMLRENQNMLPLYALQIEGAGNLESSTQFLDACERLHQRHIPHPLKHFKDIKIDWLEFIHFANREEIGFSSDVAVYDCLQKFYSASTSTASRLAGLSGQLNAKIIKEETAIQALKERIQESERAEFSPIQAMLKGDGIEEFQFAIAMRNTGNYAATEIHFRGFVWDEALRGDLKVLGDELAHDVPAGIAIESCFVSRIKTMNCAPYFVVLTVEYKPNPKLTTTKQTFYFKFRGIKDGNFDPVLVIATRGEKEAIERRFAEELQRVGLKS